MLYIRYYEFCVWMSFGGIIMRKLTGHIFLIGFMGSGKTSTAIELCDKLEISEIDTDKFITERVGMSIPEIFETKGEEQFRKYETSTLVRISQMSPRVVACGGGIVLNKINVKKMKRMGTIFLLNASPESIYERIKDTDDRPLLKGNMNIEYISNMLKDRMPAYEAAADILINTDGLTPKDVAQRIVEAI